MRLYLSTWLFATFLLFNLYSSGLYSVLAFAAYEEAIDTTANLIHAAVNGKATFGTLQDSYYLAAFQSATQENEAFYAIGNNLAHHQVHLFDGAASALGALEKRPQLIVILPRIILAYSRHTYRGTVKFHIGRDSLIADTQAFALAKGSPLVAPFNSL